jgi:hypothetical protein
MVEAGIGSSSQDEGNFMLESSVIPSFCGLWGWRKERIGKGQNLVESNPGGRRRVRLLLSG